MALPSTIYRASIDLSDIDHDRYGELQATVARHPSETAERLVARLLAYALCHEEDLVFTRGVGAGEEPDLWARGADGRVRLWVEVGLPEADRLVKAARHAERVILLAFGSSRRHWENTHLPRLAPVSNLTVLALHQPLVDRLVQRLQRSVRWGLTVSGGTLYMAVDGETVEGPLALLHGEDFR